MKTVISASRRTDIPAFYLNWFMQVVRQGGIDVRNPVYRKNEYHVDLTPDKVEWIVFWSRNYAHFLRNKDFFHPYRLYFHFTVVSYHPLLEKVRISKPEALKQAENLATAYGGDHVIWRYDPIVLWRDGDKVMSNFDPSEFAQFCHLFSNFGIYRCYFSFAHIYPKFIRRFSMKYPELSLGQIDNKFRLEILEQMKQIACESDVDLYSCCNTSITDEVVLKGSCISGTLLNQLSGTKCVSEAMAATRMDCGCTRSVDIGNYIEQPCYIGCIYCYANPVWK